MIDKIIEALRIAVIADTGCTLTAEQCDRLIDALALKDEEIARLREVINDTLTKLETLADWCMFPHTRDASMEYSQAVIKLLEEAIHD